MSSVSTELDAVHLEQHRIDADLDRLAAQYDEMLAPEPAARDTVPAAPPEEPMSPEEHAALDKCVACREGILSVKLGGMCGDCDPFVDEPRSGGDRWGQERGEEVRLPGDTEITPTRRTGDCCANCRHFGDKWCEMHETDVSGSGHCGAHEP